MVEKVLCDISRNNKKPELNARLILGSQKVERNSANVSYYPKKNKIVTLLSTMHNDKGIDSCGENNPEIKQYYISTNGGVYTMDQMLQ